MSSNLALRSVVGAALIGVALTSVLLGDIAFWLLCVVLGLFMMAEWADLHAAPARSECLLASAAQVTIERECASVDDDQAVQRSTACMYLGESVAQAGLWHVCARQVHHGLHADLQSVIEAGLLRRLQCQVNSTSSSKSTWRTKFCILAAMSSVRSAVLPPAPHVMSQKVGP